MFNRHIVCAGYWGKQEEKVRAAVRALDVLSVYEGGTSLVYSLGSVLRQLWLISTALAEKAAETLPEGGTCGMFSVSLSYYIIQWFITFL